MGAHVPKVGWRCSVCPKVELRMPSLAIRKCCYGCRGEHLRRFGNVGNRRGVENRIRRVMFTSGLSRERALDFISGWRQGYQAGRSAHAREIRVGSAEWERSA